MLQLVKLGAALALSAVTSRHNFMLILLPPPHTSETCVISAAGAFNYWINVDYSRVVPDRKNHRVVVDLTETIVSHLFAFTLPLRVRQFLLTAYFDGAECVVDHLPLLGHTNPSEPARRAGRRSKPRPRHQE